MDAPARRPAAAAGLPSTLLIALGCAAAPAIAGPATAQAGAAGGTAAPNVVDVTSHGMSFDAPAEIPGGWTTFRFHNRTGVTHFVALERMPAGRSVDDSRADIVPVFQDVMDRIDAGDPEGGFAQFERLPAWFADVVFVGGPGLTAPGGSSQTTVHVEPGTYVIECYVKTPDGTFHSSLGMIQGLTVTGARSEGAEPEAGVRVAITGDGIRMEGSPAIGVRTFRVHFEEQSAHEHGLGHDVHLVRLEPDTDMKQLARWMDWSAPGGLASPAPATFLGGTQELPAGGIAYFTAELTPGRYALVAEVPDPAGKGLLRTFEVHAPRSQR